MFYEGNYEKERLRLSDYQDNVSIWNSGVEMMGIVAALTVEGERSLKDVMEICEERGANVFVRPEEIDWEIYARNDNLTPPSDLTKYQNYILFRVDETTMQRLSANRIKTVETLES